MRRKGFTLLEVLVAGSVLFIVGASVVTLTNSIIQGTINTTDKAVMNRWATEGLEVVKKIRDDNVLSNAFWLQQAIEPANIADGYGWYTLGKNVDNSGSTKYLLQAVRKDPKLLPRTIVDSADPNSREVLTSNNLIGYRVICIEAVAAKQKPQSDLNYIYCNANDNGETIPRDGSRNDQNKCTGSEDVYCEATKASVNKNSSTTALREKIIPAGNAVKVRSLVVWQSKDRYYYSDMGALFTNWQWRGNVSN